MGRPGPDALFRQFFLEPFPGIPEGIDPERESRTGIVKGTEFYRLFQSIPEFPPSDQPFRMVIFQGDPLQFMVRSLGKFPLVPGPGQLTQCSVHQLAGPFVDPLLGQLDAFVAGRRCRDPVQVQQLVGPQPQDHQHQGIQFPQRPVHHPGQIPVQGPHGLDRAIDQFRSQFPVKGGQGSPPQALSQSQVCIGSPEKDLFQYQ